MTTDITELAQRNELLIANGQQTADLLRHLADNEIDSDHFAVVSECESYGKETDAELSITEFALRAAGYVDALVEALEKAKGMETYWKTQCRGITDHCEELQARIAQLESRTVKLPKPHAHLIWIQAGHAPDDYWDDVAVSHSEKDRCCDGSERYPVYARWEIEEMLTAAGIKVEAE
ncbi:hypothetical protein WDR07_19540 [Klebsiella pneumoniae]|uniref:hypothetical protein n=1 Tax=Klebsiella pneumoniae TaxID=573 RepID=UPI001D00EE03|nr:hypothetical protein [Klebsiella pneumoniae]MDY2437861.1 hypothetical protein [Klebsiella pneumoniae]